MAAMLKSAATKAACVRAAPAKVGLCMGCIDTVSALHPMPHWAAGLGPLPAIGVIPTSQHSAMLALRAPSPPPSTVIGKY
jgi:hypothetical protein